MEASREVSMGPEDRALLKSLLVDERLLALGLQASSLPGFALYRLQIEGGRLVAGFGSATNLGTDDFRGLAGE